MDFHTPDLGVGRVAEDFCAKTYVETLVKAGVNSLVSFVKCHHGYHYSRTDIGLSHPSLPPELDLFGEILDECRQSNIGVMAYYSVGWLSTVQKNRPDWMERDIDGDMQGTVGQKVTGPWANICLNSPYVTDTVLPELAELVSNYDIDALWLDIIECQPCYCQHCKAKYFELYGEELPKDREKLAEFVLRTKREFLSACRETVQAVVPNLPMTYNTAGRDETLSVYADFLSIETHPGSPTDKEAWEKSLLTYKYLQCFEKPWESSTSRFIHGWGGWDDQTPENMTVVASRITAHGGMVNMGDQAYPQGTLDGELYSRIGDVFSYIKERELPTHCYKRYPLVAVITGEFDIYATANHGYLGAVKALSQNGIPFDIVRQSALDKLTAYRFAVVPEIGRISDDAVTALRAFVSGGGKLLITGRYVNEERLFDLLGVTAVQDSDYSVGYVTLSDEVGQGLRRSPLLVPSAVHTVMMSDDIIGLSDAYNPLIEPTPNDFMIFRDRRLSPPDSEKVGTAITLNSYGDGKVVYCAFDMFSAINAEGQWYFKRLFGNIAEMLYRDMEIRVICPSTVEVNVTQSEEDVFIHLVQYTLQNGENHVEYITPAFDVVIEMASDIVDITGGAVLLPSNTVLPLEVVGDRVKISVGEVSLYSIVKIAKSKR